MTRIRIPFTKDQKEFLESNPFTLSVNDYQIKFTIEFKKFLLAERQKNNTPWKEIFRKAGYDPDIFGQTRISAIVRNIQTEAKSSKGLHETSPSKQLDKTVEKKQTQKAIRELQDEVVRLQQQIEFLKKIQMLRVLEENDD